MYFLLYLEKWRLGRLKMEPKKLRKAVNTRKKGISWKNKTTLAKYENNKELRQWLLS